MNTVLSYNLSTKGGKDKPGTKRFKRPSEKDTIRESVSDSRSSPNPTNSTFL